MKISTLINTLERELEKHGDSDVVIEVDYHGGDCGGHNCSKEGSISYLYHRNRYKTLVLSGDEKL